MDQFRVRQEGTDVQFIVNGRLIAQMDWRHAQQTARAIMSVAKLAEEHAMRDRIITDHAILLRAGVPVGLTSNPKLKEMAAHVAAWGRDLRRYMPGGIKSEENVGTPAVYRHEPR